jgi:aminopeptidase 2
MEENWDELARRLPAGLSMLGSLVSICTSSFTSLSDLTRVEKFFSGRNTKGFEMGLAQSLESIQAKAAWLDRDRTDVAIWVEDNGYGGKNIKSEL